MRGPWMIAPWRHRPERIEPERARPVPFCFHGLRPPPDTVVRLLVFEVHARWLAR